MAVVKDAMKAMERIMSEKSIARSDEIKISYPNGPRNGDQSPAPTSRTGSALGSDALPYVMSDKNKTLFQEVRG